MRIYKAEEVAERIKNLRENRGMTVIQLSEKSGVNINTIFGIEDYKMIPSFDTAVMLARGLGVTTDFLAFGIDAVPDEMVERIIRQHAGAMPTGGE